MLLRLYLLKNHILTSSYTIYIKSGTPVKSFLDIKKIVNSIIEIKKFNGSFLNQCFKCQNFEHVSFICSLTFRCVKCGLNHHSPNECLIKSDSPPELIYCILCKNKGHSARYSKCPSRIQYIELRENKFKN